MARKLVENVIVLFAMSPTTILTQSPYMMFVNLT